MQLIQLLDHLRQHVSRAKSQVIGHMHIGIYKLTLETYIQTENAKTSETHLATSH